MILLIHYCNASYHCVQYLRTNTYQSYVLTILLVLSIDGKNSTLTLHQILINLVVTKN